MESNSNKLKWCKARFGKDNNWWVYETSDKVNWDADGISVIDPRQTAHLVETLLTLREYGLDESIVEKAFFTFVIESKEADKGVKLVRTTDSVFDSEEQIFLFPDNLDDERSPYAEFLNHITTLQVKMLNSIFEFEEDLAIEDLEDEVREHFNSDYMEGKAIHVFYEIMDILEYAPEGYSLEDEDEEEEEEEFEENYDDEIEDLPDEEEALEEDDTMQWEDDEEEEVEDYRAEERDSSFGDDEDF